MYCPQFVLTSGVCQEEGVEVEGVLVNAGGASAFPGMPPEFRGYQSFRTHDLKVLLRLGPRRGGADCARSGMEYRA